MFRAAHPGFGLVVVDDSHFDYKLLRAAPLRTRTADGP
jgi:hypothetical protein